MYNKIRLIKGKSYLSKKEHEKFNQGDCIWGDGAAVEELKNWNMSEEKEAQEELKKYRCEYTRHIETWTCEEYALEYCEEDEDGDFLQGSDFYLADEAQ